MLTERDYSALRGKLLTHGLEELVAAERRYMEFLLEVVLSSADRIYEDFCQVTELLQFWVNYPPEQRGNKPRGTAIPWGEMGEKAILQSLVRGISLKNPNVTYPGLPLGSDIRFATNDALIHFDLKLTGPNDTPDEIVASPNQISGDGAIWRGGGILPTVEGVANSSVVVSGARSNMPFTPELPPFYILGGRVLLCLTYFLKAVYKVRSLGDQPLDYMELISVPNGLLLFDGPNYNATVAGLLIPGKDDKNKVKKRTRVRFNPLTQLNQWRCITISRTENGWVATPRMPGGEGGRGRERKR